MKSLLLICALCFAVAVAEEPSNTLPLFIRRAAQVWPCEAPNGCPLSARFAEDDPQGDAFVASHVFWLSVRNETDAKTKGQQLRLGHAFEPWLLNFQKRKILYITVACGISETDMNCKTFQSSFVYMFAKYAGSSNYSMDDVFEGPSEIIFETLRVAYGIPDESLELKEMIPMTGLTWKETRLFVLTATRTGQAQFINIELSGFLQQFGVPVFQLKTEDYESRVNANTGDLAIYDTNSCDVESLQTCQFLGLASTAVGKLQSTTEEIACDIFLVKHPSHKIHVKEHDAGFIRDLMKICPVVVVIQEHLAKELPAAAVDAALTKHKNWKLVAILFDDKTDVQGIEPLESMTKSGVPARILIRKDRWSVSQSHGIDALDAEVFRISLEDTVAVYKFQRSTRPETTYLRASNSEDSFFTLSHDLQNYLDSKGLGLSSKAKFITGRQFSIALKLPFIIIHFYQAWNPVCRAVHEVIARATKIFRNQYQTTRLFFTSINCFKEDQICQEQGVKIYPTLKIYSRRGAEDFNEMVTVRNLLRPAVLSIKNLKTKIVDEKRWEKVLKDFAPIMDLLFVGVDLSESEKKSFAEAAEVLKRTDLLIEANRPALPVEIQKALPNEKGCIFAVNPQLRTVEGILSKDDKAAILDFVRNSKLFILTELTIGGLFDIQQRAKPLLIAFVRQLDSDLTGTLLGITKAYKDQAFVRWMNASSIDTVGVMQAYNVTHTPSLVLKIDDKIFPYQGPRMEAKAVGAWIGEVTGKKVPSQFTLKNSEHRRFSQYLDHVGSIYDENPTEKNALPTLNDQGTSRPTAQMKDEL